MWQGFLETHCFLYVSEAKSGQSVLPLLSRNCALTSYYFESCRAPAHSRSTRILRSWGIGNTVCVWGSKEQSVHVLCVIASTHVHVVPSDVTYEIQGQR